MRRRAKVMLAIVVAAIAILVIAALSLTPLWPGPALPAGATRLHISTESPHLVPALGCPTALLAPARIATSGDDLVLVAVATGDQTGVVWPAGWAAWRQDGRAVLARRDGAVVGSEGEVIEGFGGGVGTDGVFHVCIIGT